jgi:hypothetical protein
MNSKVNAFRSSELVAFLNNIWRAGTPGWRQGTYRAGGDKTYCMNRFAMRDRVGRAV